jgi:hypothetical protein
MTKNGHNRGDRHHADRQNRLADQRIDQGGHAAFELSDARHEKARLLEPPLFRVRVGRQSVGAEFPRYLSEARQSGRRHRRGGELAGVAGLGLVHERLTSMRAAAPKTPRPASSSSIRNSWLYLATRSDLAMEPVLM